ncbi:hypothetical protein Tco_0403999 [Tanacetum coccineum]
MLYESDFNGFDDETVDAATTRVSTASVRVTTAGVAISTAKPRNPPTTTTIFDDEDVTMEMDQTLIKMKEEKAKEKGVAFKDVKDSSRPKPRNPPTTTTIFDDEDVTRNDQLIKMKEEKAKEKGVAFKDVKDSSRPVRSITTLQPLPSIDPKDKGKDREQYTIEERAKFLAETIAEQRKFRAAQRATKIRSRPPTKTQLRNLMMIYLKNMGGYKHSQLKGKTYKKIQGLYEREQKFIHKKTKRNFCPMDSEKEEKKSMEPESEGKKSKRLKIIAGSYET